MKSLTGGSTFRGVLALLAVTLLAVGCSSSTGVTEPAVVVVVATPTPAPAAVPQTPAPVPAQAQAQLASNLPTIGQVAPELAGLGTLIAVHSEPVQQTFDGTGGSLTLADGALVQVPSDSFPAPTNVDMVVTDLLFGKYLGDAPQGRIYRLATVEEVTLLRPMVLEIAKPAESVTVMMLEDGVWTEQTIPDLDTTRVEITHFSANLVAVVDKADCAPPADALCGENGQAPYVDYKLLNSSKSPSISPLAAMTDSEFTACAGLCPSRTASGAPAQGSTDQGSTDNSAATQPPRLLRRRHPPVTRRPQPTVARLSLHLLKQQPRIRAANLPCRMNSTRMAARAVSPKRSAYPKASAGKPRTASAPGRLRATATTAVTTPACVAARSIAVRTRNSTIPTSRAALLKKTVHHRAMVTPSTGPSAYSSKATVSSAMSGMAANV